VDAVLREDPMITLKVGIASYKEMKAHAATMEGYGLVRLERDERGRITPKVTHGPGGAGPAAHAVAQGELRFAVLF
jgi:hypothetical protein